MLIRESTSDDVARIVALYPEAFPDEDLVPVVSELLDDAAIRLSLVATIDQRVVGNVIFTKCGVEDSNIRAALLAPLAVAPDCRRQGIGSALISDGLARLQQAGFELVLVLGDPAYYSRSGFEPEKAIDPPYALPPAWLDAWQSQYLGEAASCTGTLVVPPPWQHRALWSD